MLLEELKFSEEEIDCTILFADNENRFAMIRNCCNHNPLAVCRASAGIVGILLMFTMFVMVLYLVKRQVIKKLNTLIYVTQVLILLTYAGNISVISL